MVKIIEYLYITTSIAFITIFFINRCEKKSIDNQINNEIEVLKNNIEIISKQNNTLDSINNELIIELANLQVKKDTIKIRYERKINSIDTLNISDVSDKFKSIFSKHGIN